MAAKRDRAGSVGGRSRRVAVAVVTTGVVLTGAVAVAGTGAPENTGVAGGAAKSAPSHADEMLVATGTTPVAGAWRLSTYAGVDGLPCLRLMLTTAVTPASGSGWCGETNRDFLVSALPVTIVDGRAEVILFGVAPESATRVELASAGGKWREARALEAGSTVYGRPWVIAHPLGVESAQVSWLDASGNRHGTRDVSSEFERAAAQRLAVMRSEGG